MRIRTACIAAACFAALSASPALAQKWGNLKGRFVYDGEAPKPEKIDANKDPQICAKTQKYDETLVVGENGGIANIVIYLKTKNPKVHPDYAAEATKIVIIDNKECRFEPHIVPLVLTQTLEIHNTDPMISHNANLAPIGDKQINPNIPSGQKEVYKASRSQSVGVTVACNIHTWMRGYVFPRDNPYIAVTDKDGNFEIENLPVGEHEFRVWHEKPGYLVARPEWKLGNLKIAIKEGDNDLGGGEPIKVPPKALEPKK